MKRFFSITVLLLFMFNMTGIYFVFRVQQSRIRREIKHQIKSGIPEDELHEFYLTIEEYHQLDWVRPEIEFRKGNEMFDVVCSEILGKTITLKCVNDKEEAVLFAQLDEKMQKKIEQESNAPTSPISKVIKTLKLVYDKTDFNLSLACFARKHSLIFTHLQPLFPPPYLEVLTPPPSTV